MNRANNCQTFFFSLFFMNSLLLNLLFINLSGEFAKVLMTVIHHLGKTLVFLFLVLFNFDFFSATFSNLVIALSASYLTKTRLNIYDLWLGLFKRIQKGFLKVAKQNSWVCLGFKRFEDCIEFLKINNNFNNIILSV